MNCNHSLPNYGHLCQIRAHLDFAIIWLVSPTFDKLLKVISFEYAQVPSFNTIPRMYILRKLLRLYLSNAFLSPKLGLTKYAKMQYFQNENMPEMTLNVGTNALKYNAKLLVTTTKWVSLSMFKVQNLVFLTRFWKH